MSTRQASAAAERITRGAASVARHVGGDLNDRVAEATVRLQTIPCSTGIDSSSVIHILDKRSYRASVDVLKMPTRRPTREPSHPCPVAVLKDQEA